MKVVNCTLYSDNPYTSLMYSALRGRFEPVRGTVEDAIGLLKRGESNILHVNWEEHVIRRAASVPEAGFLVEEFLSGVRKYRELGGRVLWTVHNELPHELEYTSIFHRLRRELSALADRIIVHSAHAVTVLNRQIAVDASKIYLVPHPSYLGCYEPSEVTFAEWVRPVSRTALAFGKVRAYKGYRFLLKSVSEHSSELGLRVVGEPLRDDLYGEELNREFCHSPRISFEYRRVEDAEVPGLLRAHRCLVLPYERFLTSGVALLGLTLGVPVVAPNTPQMRETLPPLGHAFLFVSGSSSDLIRALEEATRLDDDGFHELRHQCARHAQHIAPECVSSRLGDLIDSL